MLPMPADEPVGTAETLLGTQVGDYRIISQLGQGTLGVVYAAEHITLGHRTACKILRPEVMRHTVPTERNRPATDPQRGEVLANHGLRCGSIGARDPSCRIASSPCPL